MGAESIESPPNLTSPLAGPVVTELPAPPRSLRARRYRGEDRAVPLSSLTEADRAAVTLLYELLKRFDATLRAVGAREDVEEATRLAASFDVDQALSVARVLGASEDALSDEVRHALHDVRGGALTSLLLEVQRARIGKGERRVSALRTLTSDHLKIMRNALLELDDVRRAEDLAPVEHKVERLAETLGRITASRPQGTVEVLVDCKFRGGITMSCVELGALDRAALNLVNNAVRHSAGERVEVLLDRVGAAPDGDLRMCVANRIEAADARALYDRFGEELARIFVEPFSTTGSGDGLKICADFVASAYGLVLAAETARSGLVGATVERDWFVAWLCWPAVS